MVLEGERIATGYRQGKQVAEVHQGLDFCLSGGELTCLLGCNGAGKSTCCVRCRHAAPLSGRLELMGGLWRLTARMSVPKPSGGVDRPHAGRRADRLQNWWLWGVNRTPVFRTFDFCRQNLGMAGVGRGRHGRKGTSLCGRTVRRGASESYDCQGAGTRMSVDSFGRAYGFFWMWRAVWK